MSTISRGDFSPQLNIFDTEIKLLLLSSTSDQALIFETNFPKTSVPVDSVPDGMQGTAVCLLSFVFFSLFA